ncbi:hypothetical protein PpBr36_00536 [Pyricularia pennisetigena]|uniref:hypothetical protein n=1 Tax=Pyricularia pennisetigena TaxID=1578925 RepID=UPI0011504BE5|nr:hypothetical protein PpBr36_00536 [Pyricularia pennisetigena]TLS27953.1 hypothetical protein PpBr36_00536 [Pyricularia pennisetigena]
MQSTVINQHPYFPEDASIPDFVPNDKSLTDIVLPFSGTITCVLAASVILSKRYNPGLGLTDLGQICWFVLSYLVLNYERVASSNELYAQLWKEYSLSDSRYLTASTFVITIETITVLPIHEAILGASIRKICWALDVAERTDQSSLDPQSSTQADKKIQ